MGSTTMHILCVIGKDGVKRIAQLWLVGELQNILLVMMDKKYWRIKVLISTETKNKLRDGLKTHGVLNGAWDPASLDKELSMSVKKGFVDTLVKIMPDDKCKTRVEGLLCDGTYPFTYDVKTTKPGKFPDPELFHVDNFQVGTSVVVEVRLQSWNFKPKGATKVLRGYSFKPVGLYRIQDIQVAPPSTPEKRWKENDKWISTPPRTRVTDSVLNPLQWIMAKEVLKSGKIRFVSTKSN